MCWFMRDLLVICCDYDIHVVVTHKICWNNPNYLDHTDFSNGRWHRYFSYCGVHLTLLALHMIQKYYFHLHICCSIDARVLNRYLDPVTAINTDPKLAFLAYAVMVRGAQCIWDQQMDKQPWMHLSPVTRPKRCSLLSSPADESSGARHTKTWHNIGSSLVQHYYAEEQITWAVSLSTGNHSIIPMHYTQVKLM